MTTVVIDFKNKKIVADRQRTCTNMRYSLLKDNYKEVKEEISYEQCNKIHCISEGVYAVGAGSVSEITNQVTNLKNYGYINNRPESDCTLAVVRVKGDGLFVDTYTYNKPSWFSKKGKFTHKAVQGDTNVITFGSGGNYAYGAFMGGLSAEDSVRAASRCDQYTSYEIDVVQL